MLNELNYNKVGAKMKELRIAAGISQQTIANDIGTTIAFVSNIENNKVKINLRMVIYYAELCGVPVDIILDAGRDTPRYFEHDKIDAQLHQALQAFTTEEKQKILQMLKIAKK